MSDLIAYAYDFISYLMLQRIPLDFKIRKILLYGSAARGDYKKTSDIDLFVDSDDAKKELTHLKEEIIKAERSFLNSDRIKKWINLGIKNDFSIIVGNLNEKKWDDLKRSMLLHAYVLWERYTEAKQGAKPFALIKWYLDSKDPIKRVSVSRKLYGYTAKGKKYEGIFKRLRAVKLGKGIAIIPLEDVQVLRKMFTELKVKYTLYDIFM